MFDLPELRTSMAYVPSFRSLFPFFARSGREAFVSAFRHHRSTSVGEQQIYNAFLLDLGWRYAHDWQLLRERENLLKAYKTASEAGVATSVSGSLGELDAERVRLEQAVAQTAENLKHFRVHPEYDRIEQEASKLTRQLHDLANENVSDGRLLNHYERSVSDEGLESPASVGSEALEQAYQESGIALPGLVKKRLTDVQEFHRALVTGRRDFLSAEVGRLKRAILERKAEIAKLDLKRAERMNVLKTHGALAEYSRLQTLHSESEARLNEVRRQISELRKLEEGRSQLRIELETLRQTTRHDLDDRSAARERAIALFNANSEALYDAPGNLIIDVGKNGYEFGVEIERAGATGIENMKVFCYDLTLIQLWAQ